MEIGTLVAGKYLLERVVGHGGMGVVLRATHLQLRQPVAIKFLLPDALQSTDAVQRFFREARAAARLRSEHVAHVLDVGAHHGTPYIVLEFLDGTDLASFPRAQLTAGLLIDLVLQACEALGAAHAAGIVHRDIKPANFFITRSAGGGLCLKLLDFGVSKTIDATGKLTASQVMLGTPVYMSPEQMRRAHDVDARSDIWSLGAMLYELVEGVPPFETAAFSAMVLKIVNDPAPKLTARLPPGLDKIIYRCLEKDPERRFQRIAELAAVLAPYAGSRTQAAITLERLRGIHVTRPITAGDPDAQQVSMAPTVRAAARRRLRPWVVVAGVLACAGIAFATIGSNATADAPRAASAVPDRDPEPPTAAAPQPDPPAATPPEPLASAPTRPAPPSAPARRPKRPQRAGAVKAQPAPLPSEPHHDQALTDSESPRFDRGD